MVEFHLDGSTQLRAKGYRSPFGRLYTQIVLWVANWERPRVLAWFVFILVVIGTGMTLLSERTSGEKWEKAAGPDLFPPAIGPGFIWVSLFAWKGSRFRANQT